MSDQLCLPRSPFLLWQLMLRAAMGTLLGHDVGACLGPPDPWHMGTFARLAPARFFAPSLQSFVPSGSWAFEVGAWCAASVVSSQMRWIAALIDSQVTLAQGTTGDDATVGYRPSPTKNAARPTRIMRVMPTPSFRLASCASISAINDSDHDQSIGAEREAVRRTPLDARDRTEAGGCLGTLPQTP
jgi:hypothetical protein